MFLGKLHHVLLANVARNERAVTSVGSPLPCLSHVLRGGTRTRLLNWKFSLWFLLVAILVLVPLCVSVMLFVGVQSSKGTHIIPIFLMLQMKIWKHRTWPKKVHWTQDIHWFITSFGIAFRCIADPTPGHPPELGSDDSDLVTVDRTWYNYTWTSFGFRRDKQLLGVSSRYLAVRV